MSMRTMFSAMEGFPPHFSRSQPRRYPIASRKKPTVKMAKAKSILKFSYANSNDAFAWCMLPHSPRTTHPSLG